LLFISFDTKKQQAGKLEYTRLGENLWLNEN